MTTIVKTDRSRVEQFQRCARSRWLGYHQDGMGITSTKLSLPLAVGRAVHAGLAVLLREGQAAYAQGASIFDQERMNIEEHAVQAALADFAEYQDSLELDLAEQNAMNPTEEKKDLK